MRTAFRHHLFARLIFHLALVLVTRHIAFTQDVAKLETVPHPKYPGVRVANAQGYTGPKGNSFSFTNLGLSQSIIIYVSEAKFGHRVRVELAKFDDFLEPLRSCQTTAGRACVLQTRTDDDLFIRVKSLDQDGAGYFLVVWTGAETKAELPSLFTPSLGGVATKPNSQAIAVSPSNDSDAAEQITAKFFAYDAGRKMLVVKDAVGTTFEFALPSEAKLNVSGKAIRVDEYLKAHFNNLPYASDQQLRIAWKPSASGKGRVVVAVR